MSSGQSQSQTQVEPEIGDISPVVPAGVEKEPMLLLDTTTSMTWDNDEGSGISRWQIIQEALPPIVAKLGEEDSQAEAEAAAGEDAGGLMTATFAGGQAHSVGDLRPENLKEKFTEIEAKLGGGTVIMPGWELLQEMFMEEFGNVPKMDRPQMLALIITDGEANDTQQFADAISKAKDNTHICLAVMGHGGEHDKALKIYQDIAAKNDHVRVVSFGNKTTPDQIVSSVISLLG